jgi:hypothetical protein
MTRPKPSKYRNRKVTVGELSFDSVKEANRFAQLQLMERAGNVANLRRQVRYPLIVNGAKVCTYVADHVYDEKIGPDEWAPIVEDVKGYRTDIYRLKAKLFEAIHGFPVREV